ncbi:Uma2 family endonuclease [Microcoleus sp. FACHB-68]|uniref:Uma2 family endonuclease n=1 Tax=Microcoleus sp. FACHB-68 TaxID=2692826 RepID=UPI0016884F19|nr:Uma2 family endonuclease [Microcoleus sp. FACHB-68]MBD1938493.1 Uma2 family endonuclease [Microcoleus sp. FACHB-68]
MPAQTEKRYYTPEEYLALEEAAEYKSEYRNGEIVPMTGGTTNHNQIIGNLYANLHFAFRRQNYRVFMNDVRLWMTHYKLYTYPDIMVIEGEPVYYENRTDTVTNPLIIVEVLSKSTKNYDRGDKFDCYRSIPEFKEYILIDQYRFHVEQFSKTSEGKWLLSYYESADAVLTLSSINFTIALSEMYERVDFELREE